MTAVDSPRKQATYRGLSFIYQNCLDDRNFEDWAGDYLWCFHCISSTAKDPHLRKLAREMGEQSARRWYSQQHALPGLSYAGEVAYYVSLIDVASRLGIDDDRLREHVFHGTLQFTAREYLDFDPVKEPPPLDLPAPCSACEAVGPRGSTHCGECGALLRQRSRYDVWCDALVLTYTADAFGMPLGASYCDVLRWLPAMRPYRGPEGGANPEFRDTVYAVTHLVYSLNDYNRHRLSPDWLPPEFEFLQSNWRHPLDAGDPELLGEFLDSLRALGLPDDAPAISSGLEYLLSTQNTDGSWGDIGEPDVHKRYHTTWTAIDALRDYDWSGNAALPDAVRRILGASL